MPITPTYPGVYIEEIPSGVRTIVGVATSIAAFVDFFKRGPMNRAIQIFSMGDFEREFGGLDKRSEASYAIQQFFLNGGAEACVVRVGQAGAFDAASIELRDEPGGEVLRVTAGRRMRGVSVEDPGEWGNLLRVEVDYDTTDPTTLFNFTVSEEAIHNGRRVTVRTETYRNLTMAEGVSNNAIEVVNEGSRLVQLSRDAAWPLNRPAQNGTIGIDATLAQLVAGTDTFNVDAQVVTLDFPAAPASLQEVRTRLQAAIRAADATNPLLAGATVQLVNGHFRILAGRSGADFDPETILVFGEESTTLGASLGLVGAGVIANVQKYSLGTGAAGAQSNAVAGADASVQIPTPCAASRTPTSQVCTRSRTSTCSTSCACPRPRYWTTRNWRP